jgi:hypothetical protein
MSEQVKYAIEDLSELEYKLIINCLKVFRGDWDEQRKTQIWHRELNDLLKKLGYPEERWGEK